MLRQADNNTKHSLTSHSFNSTLVIVLLWLLGSITSQPQNGNGSVEEIRTLYPSEWSVAYPAGLAYASTSDQIFLLDRGNSGSLRATRPTMAVITPYEDLVAMVQLPVTMDDVINMTYDDANQNLLLLDNKRGKLAQFTIDEAGQLDDSAYFDIAHFGLEDAEGIAIDAVGRHLFILDKGALQVIRADIDNGFRTISRVDIKHLGSRNVRGIAVHPRSHNLFIVSSSKNMLYELTQAGQIVNRYDLAPLALVDSRAIVFAPSADLTDDPTIIHLYLTDSNVRGEVLPKDDWMVGLGKMCRSTSKEFIDGFRAGTRVRFTPAKTGAVYGRVLELALNPASSHGLCSFY